jgi:hypothetical protein
MVANRISKFKAVKTFSFRYKRGGDPSKTWCSSSRLESSILHLLKNDIKALKDTHLLGVNKIYKDGIWCHRNEHMFEDVLHPSPNKKSVKQSADCPIEIECVE